MEIVIKMATLVDSGEPMVVKVEAILKGTGSHGGDSGGHHQGQGCSGGSYAYKEGGGGGYLGIGESGDVNGGKAVKVVLVLILVYLVHK